MADWKIQKPLGQCSGTGQAIESGTEYIATLVEGPEGLRRTDYSIRYFEDNKPDVYCYWKSCMPTAERKKKIFVDDDMLKAFFERLEDESDPEKINFRFVLALVLMRKRIVKYYSSVQIDDREVWTVKVTGQPQEKKVVNPHLSEEQIEQLSGQLGQILQVEFDE